MCEFFLAADVVLRDLGARDHEHVVQALRPDGFARNLVQVGLEAVLGDGKLAVSERRHAPGPRQQIALHQDVIRDRHDVEMPGLAVEVDDLAHRQPPVAPARVDMKVAQQKRLVSRHVRSSRRCGRDPRDDDEGSRTRSSRRYNPNTSPLPPSPWYRPAGCPHPTVRAVRTPPIAREPAAQVRVLAVKLHRAVETADGREALGERTAEVAAIQGSAPIRGS